MPYFPMGVITMPQQSGLKAPEDDDWRRIEALEADNFKLRDEITRLTVHNSTLRRMLKLEGRFASFRRC
jgi:hypothetical protein